MDANTFTAARRHVRAAVSFFILIGWLLLWFWSETDYRALIAVLEAWIEGRSIND